MKKTLYEYVQATYSYISIEERVKEDKTMNLIKQLVNKKLNHISTKDLLKYSKEYEVPITTAQADQIVVLMKGKNINIYDNDERLELLKQIAKVTSCYCPTSKYFISATTKIRRDIPPYCALIFQEVLHQKYHFSAFRFLIYMAASYLFIFTYIWRFKNFWYVR